MMSLAFDYRGPTPRSDTEIFRADVLSGLSARRKTLPAKYFYDSAGSLLFDRITELDEYYPTRTETALLTDIAGEIAHLAGPDAVVVEFGAGSLAKIRILLDALRTPRAYMPIDVSGAHLMAAAAELRGHYPELHVTPIIADFTEPLTIPFAGNANVFGFFPGSTIGNFDPPEARRFLRRASATLPKGALFLVGADTKKDRAILERAYNDSEGVTAAFNLNLLARINRELGGDFDLSRFRHRAFYNHDLGRIEMHLESTGAQTVHVAGRSVRFAEGETIHTENSYKYSAPQFATLAASSGWTARRLWTADRNLFALHLLENA